MTHHERCQQHVSVLLNKLLRTDACRAPNEHRALRLLENYVEAPAFYPDQRRALIQEAFRVHHLPDPYDTDAWCKRMGI